MAPGAISDAITAAWVAAAQGRCARDVRGKFILLPED